MEGALGGRWKGGGAAAEFSLVNPINSVISQSSIQVGVADGAVWIRVEGRGSFQNSTPLKDFARQMLAGGHRNFYVDLKDCLLMDSTFMGTLAGIALKIKSEGFGELHVVNSNERNNSLLCNLGLNQLLKMDGELSGFDVTESKMSQQTTLSAVGGNKLDEAKTMLEAHEAVVAATPAVAAQFKDVLECLRQNIEAKK